jgi:hypothetical protein
VMVLLKQVRNGTREEVKTRLQCMHHFSSPEPRLICVVAPDSNGDSSSFDFFTLMLTEELFNTILTEMNHYYQQNIKKDENTANRYHCR